MNWFEPSAFGNDAGYQRGSCRGRESHNHHGRNNQLHESLHDLPLQLLSTPYRVLQ